MSHNDPTERDAEQAQQLEPMNATVPYYESYDTYDYAQYPYSPYAPPPPGKNKKILVFTIATIVIMAFVLSGIITAVLLLKQNNVPATLTPTPGTHPATSSTTGTTAVATSQITRAPQVSYSAGNVYAAFSQAGIRMSNPSNDTHWSCCTYYPEGGALVWTDLSTGNAVDIATFGNVTEAYVDSGELLNQHFPSTSYRKCLLSYDPAFPSSELALYTRVMADICT